MMENLMHNSFSSSTPISNGNVLFNYITDPSNVTPASKMIILWYFDKMIFCKGNIIDASF